MSNSEIQLHRNLTGNPPVIIASWPSALTEAYLDYTFKSYANDFSIAWPTSKPIHAAFRTGLEALSLHKADHDALERPVTVMGKNTVFANVPIKLPQFYSMLDHYSQSELTSWKANDLKVQFGSATLRWLQSEDSVDSGVAGEMIYTDQVYSRKVVESLFARTLPPECVPGITEILDGAGTILDLHLAPVEAQVN
jgi:hypothetical protein